MIKNAKHRRLELRATDIRGAYRTALDVFTGHRPRRCLMRALPISNYRCGMLDD